MPPSHHRFNLFNQQTFIIRFPPHFSFTRIPAFYISSWFLRGHLWTRCKIRTIRPSDDLLTPRHCLSCLTAPSFLGPNSDGTYSSLHSLLSYPWTLKTERSSVLLLFWSSWINFMDSCQEASQLCVSITYTRDQFVE